MREAHASPHVDKLSQSVSVANLGRTSQVYKTTNTESDPAKNYLHQRSAVELRRAALLEEPEPEKLTSFNLGAAYHNVAHDEQFKKGKRLFPQGPHISPP